MSKTSKRVSKREIAQYKTDGATLIKGALSSDWQQFLEKAVERVNASSANYTSRFTMNNGSGKLMMDQYPHLRDEGINSFIRYSPIGQIAAELMETKTLNFILDKVYYRPKGLIVPLPWHQSSPYLSCTGHNMARIWVTCDHSPKELSLRIIRGSHLWNVFYRPVIIDDPKSEIEPSGFLYHSSMFDDSLPELPDFDDHLDSFEVLSWDIEPGDVLVVNANSIHAARGGVNSQVPQRGLGVFLGAGDVIYDKHPGLPDLAEIKGVAATPGCPISECPEVFFPVPQHPEPDGGGEFRPLDSEQKN